MDLKEKRVLIVGGGSGIGYAVAESSIADGAQVMIASTNLARLEPAASRLGNGTTASRLDLTNESEVAVFFDQCGGFDHIVTTAGDWGGMRSAKASAVDIASARRVFDVRFWGALMLAKYGATVLATNGSLTFTGGMIAHKPSKGSFISTAMAGAIEHLTRALAVELAPLRVNAVCPGLIHTAMWDSMPADRREMLDKMTKGQLMPRTGTPDEVAQAYLYLMRGGYTTGQVLFVEGGSALKS